MSTAFTVRMVRLLGGQSPMCVFQRTFTRAAADWFKALHFDMREHAREDYEMFAGEHWPVGSVLNIRKPQRFGND